MNKGLAGVLIAAAIATSGVDKHPWHYSFIMPDGYVGWIEIVYSDRDAPRHQPVRKEYRIEVGDDGIFRTGDIRVSDADPKDTFLYRSKNPDGTTTLKPVPPDYVLGGTDHGGFAVSEAGDGRHWFIFIGPPELRARTPFADWPKEVEARMKKYGTADLGPPNPLPKPGRMTDMH